MEIFHTQLTRVHMLVDDLVDISDSSLVSALSEASSAAVSQI